MPGVLKMQSVQCNCCTVQSSVNLFLPRLEMRHRQMKDARPFISGIYQHKSQKYPSSNILLCQDLTIYDFSTFCNKLIFVYLCCILRPFTCICRVLMFHHTSKHFTGILCPYFVLYIMLSWIYKIYVRACYSSYDFQTILIIWMPLD